ncbi:MAG: flagellar basal body-associated FliL family protein [Pseudomonadota bacterium]|nr:flagellar basal body-associated FliL family protein [Pseudomonadota bacterium]
MAEPAAAPRAPEPSAGGKGGKPIVMILLVIINMAAVAGVGVMLYLKNQKDKHEPTIEKVVSGVHGDDAKEAESAARDEELVGKTIPMEMILVNLAGSRGQSIAKVSLEFEVDNEPVIKEIEKRKPQIRDVLITLLSSKSLNEISTAEGKDSLREEIRDTVNRFLTKGKIKRVLFTDLMISK